MMGSLIRKRQKLEFPWLARVDKDKAPRLQIGLAAELRAPLVCYIRAVLLSGVRYFFRVTRRRLKN